MQIRQPLKISLFYVLTMAAVGVAIVAIIQMGSDLPPPSGAAAVAPAAGGAPPATAGGGLLEGLRENLAHPLSRLFVQLLVVLVAVRLVGKVFLRLGQPAAVGEMTAGILLGPSLFGLLAPAGFAFVFPPNSLGALRLFSEIGVCIYMFTVGLELNFKNVSMRAQTAVWVSHAGISFPFTLGVLVAYFVYSEMAAPGAPFAAFALFMGISMSITAFPILARILQERGITQTFLGATAITAAAVDDATAWTILAFVTAIARAAGLNGAAFNTLLVVVFVAVMVLAVRPALARRLGTGPDQEDPSPAALATVMTVMFAAALTSELIGIHALFGAFLTGAMMPEARGLREKLTSRLGTFSTVALLPLFFAFTGLRTQIGLLADWNGVLLVLVIMAVASLGKIGGCAVAARLTGISWRESLQLGTLMNTRALMELIALNIGYDLGILSPKIFTVLVIMAVATTMMTGPLLTLFGSKPVLAEKRGLAA